VILDTTDEQELLVETSVRFMEAECPITRVRELAEDPTGFDREWLRGGAELGWFSLLVGEEHGGGSVSGRGLIDAVEVAEEIGRHVQPGPFLPMNVVAAALARRGSDDQRADVLPALLAGEQVATWAPLDDAGRFDEGAGLVARRSAGRLTLSGSRGLVHDAHVAGWILVTASLDGRPVQALVATDTPGVRVRPRRCLDLARRLSEVRFEDVVLDEASVLGDPGGAPDELEDQLRQALVVQCAETVGVMDAMFWRTVSYSKDRIAFGRPIGSFQALKHIMADLGLWIENGRTATVAAAEAVHDQRDNAGQMASMAAAYIGDMSVEVAQQSLQLHGGIGYTWEHDLHLFMRRVSVNRALYGDPAWHRERLCALAGL